MRDGSFARHPRQTQALPGGPLGRFYDIGHKRRYLLVSTVC